MPGSESVIRSRQHPLVKRLHALKRRSRSEPELMLLEGQRLIGEALAAGVPLLEVALTPAAAAAQPALLEALRQRGVPVRQIAPELMKPFSELDSAPGSLALARRPVATKPSGSGADALVLVAAGIQNPGNLGALLRTAEAAGATAALLAEGCADPFGWKSLRGAMGSAFRLSIERFAALDPLLARLRRDGLQLVAADARAETTWHSVDYRRPTALAVGGEGAGLPEALLRSADRRVAIPMAGGVESLNVAVAAGVLLYEAIRQRRRA